MASNFDWTGDAIARLRAFWRDGHSTAEIGRRMGTSKNSVVGKAHRLGLPPRPSPIRRGDAGSLPRLPAPEETCGPPLALCPAADTPPPGCPPCSPDAPPASVSAGPPPPPPAPARSAKPVPSRPAPRHPCCWPIGHPSESA